MIPFRPSLVLAALLLASPLIALQPGDPQALAPAPLPVPDEHHSARATMRAFLEALDPDHQADGKRRLDLAAACLDLSEVPLAVRANRGQELAIQLKDILDRTLFVDFDAIPDTAEGPRYVVLERQEGDVVIDRQASGEWLFTAATVRSIPDLWLATQSQELVKGVVEAPRTFALWLRSRLPESLQQRVFLLENWQWLGLILLALLGTLLDRLVTWLAARVLHRFLRARWVDIQPLRGATRPLGLLTMTLLWWFGLTLLSLPVGALQLLSYTLVLLMTLGMVWLAYRLVDVGAAVLEVRAARTESRFDDLLVPLFRKSAKVVVTAFGLVFIAENLDIQIGSLLAGLGLGGLAFALAAQDTVKNLFGSLTVLFDRPFQVGDWVLIGSVEGTVEEVGIRSTRIRTFYNSQITLPNSQLIQASVDNYGARTFRRWSTRLGLTYSTPPERIEAFCEGVRELIRRHPYTRKDYFQVYFNEFGDHALSVLVYMFFQAPDWSTELRERHRLAVDILRLAQQLGVEFAFPTQTVHVLQEQAATPLPPPSTVPTDASLDRQMEGWREAGRRAAGEIVDSTLGNQVPPPVAFDLPESEDRGSAG